MVTETAQITSEIRKQFKAEGIKASVRTGSGHTSIRVFVKSGNIRLAEEIAKRYQQVSYDHATGEVLCGGNLFVFVEWSNDTIEAQVAKISSEFEPAITALEVGEYREIGEWLVGRCGRNEYSVSNPAGESQRAAGTGYTMKMIARMMLELN